MTSVEHMEGVDDDRLVGRRISNYEVIAPIGSGGMGAVYLARHPFIARNAAIKILHRSFVGVPAVVQRFFNEARAANAIRHPNIIEVLDVGQLPEDGLPYLLMEFLEGEPLSRRIARCGRLPIGEALSVAWEAASALEAAHAKEIVHRDLKPDNIFLARDERAPSQAKIKVLDFGVAKLHPALSGGHRQTTGGQVLGTPRYMSPEQWRGKTDEVDARADIYALGIILYEMLVGRPPFEGEGFGELAVLHQLEPPRPPRELAPEIPPALERVILKALTKSREDRIASMRELMALLADTGVARTPVELSPPAAETPTEESAARVPSASAPGRTVTVAPTPPEPTRGESAQGEVARREVADRKPTDEARSSLKPPDHPARGAGSMRLAVAGLGLVAVGALVVLRWATAPTPRSSAPVPVRADPSPPAAPPDERREEEAVTVPVSPVAVDEKSPRPAVSDDSAARRKTPPLRSAPKKDARNAATSTVPPTGHAPDAPKRMTKW